MDWTRPELVSDLMGLPALNDLNAAVWATDPPTYRDLVVIEIPESIRSEHAAQIKQQVEARVGEHVRVLVCGPGCRVRIERDIARVELVEKG